MNLLIAYFDKTFVFNLNVLNGNDFSGFGNTLECFWGKSTEKLET
jgi:hypothetical protein